MLTIAKFTHAPSVSISLVPSSSQPGPGCLLCSLMDFSPAHIQLSCSQGQQQLSGHVLATAVLPSGDWSQQLLVLLETAPQCGLSSSCQVEHVSLEHPLSRHWDLPGMLSNAAHSKMLMGIGVSVLGFVFLALGLGFCLCRKVRGDPGGGVLPPHRACVLPSRPPKPGVTPFSLPTQLLKQKVLEDIKSTIPIVILYPVGFSFPCVHPGAHKEPGRCGASQPGVFPTRITRTTDHQGSAQRGSLGIIQRRSSHGGWSWSSE
ncbi:LOW QUALITY PROTEIN: class II histocompatibility antigen, B-L beta chain-like [Poecile atricapillus]|uniref:LOW QUALITY PROTEIN: class II histocompatibility antigen, B-L beta chain-like n=1 Tax=Poecile atricapillus TaxID=48891 RepID=UPI0027384E8B|nr:LOW QUALITY PROTEIN: class II histocompatibility antigen, B-L beta chain-like [Poecile atricapillus]